MPEKATPEQFLREFALQILAANDLQEGPLRAIEEEIRGYAKLLELRETAVRIDQVKGAYRSLTDRYKVVRNYEDGSVLVDLPNIERWHNATIKFLTDELTTPNNTTNTLEDEATE